MNTLTRHFDPRIEIMCFFASPRLKLFVGLTALISLAEVVSRL